MNTPQPRTKIAYSSQEERPLEAKITPQVLIRGHNERSWPPAPPLPAIVTEKFFKPPAMDLAPNPVRWAHTLSLAWLWVIPLFVWLNYTSSYSLMENWSSTAAAPLLWGTILWTNQGLRQGKRTAWYLQIGLSVLGLFSCSCFSLLTYGYILSQWFKPEVKRWFDLH